MGIPSAPQITITSINQQTGDVYWSFTPPANTGGASIFDYYVDVVDAAGNYSSFGPISSTNTSWPGYGMARTTYTFRPYAYNSVGGSPYGTAVNVSLVGPDTPTVVSAIKGGSSYAVRIRTAASNAFTMGLGYIKLFSVGGTQTVQNTANAPFITDSNNPREVIITVPFSALPSNAVGFYVSTCYSTTESDKSALFLIDKPGAPTNKVGFKDSWGRYATLTYSVYDGVEKFAIDTFSPGSPLYPPTISGDTATYTIRWPGATPSPMSFTALNKWGTPSNSQSCTIQDIVGRAIIVEPKARVYLNTTCPVGTTYTVYDASNGTVLGTTSSPIMDSTGTYLEISTSGFTKSYSGFVSVGSNSSKGILSTPNARTNSVQLTRPSPVLTSSRWKQTSDTAGELTITLATAPTTPRVNIYYYLKNGTYNGIVGTPGSDAKTFVFPSAERLSNLAIQSKVAGGDWDGAYGVCFATLEGVASSYVGCTPAASSMTPTPVIVGRPRHTTGKLEIDLSGTMGIPAASWKLSQNNTPTGITPTLNGSTLSFVGPVLSTVSLGDYVLTATNTIGDGWIKFTEHLMDNPNITSAGHANGVVTVSFTTNAYDYDGPRLTEVASGTVYITSASATKSGSVSTLRFSGVNSSHTQFRLSGSSYGRTYTSAPFYAVDGSSMHIDVSNATLNSGAGTLTVVLISTTPLTNVVLFDNENNQLDSVALTGVVPNTPKTVVFSPPSAPGRGLYLRGFIGQLSVVSGAFGPIIPAITPTILTKWWDANGMRLEVPTASPAYTEYKLLDSSGNQVALPASVSVGGSTTVFMFSIPESSKAATSFKLAVSCDGYTWATTAFAAINAARVSITYDIGSRAFAVNKGITGGFTNTVDISYNGSIQTVDSTSLQSYHHIVPTSILRTQTRIMLEDATMMMSPVIYTIPYANVYDHFVSVIETYNSITCYLGINDLPSGIEKVQVRDMFGNLLAESTTSMLTFSLSNIYDIPSILYVRLLIGNYFSEVRALIYSVKLYSPYFMNQFPHYEPSTGMISYYYSYMPNTIWHLLNSNGDILKTSYSYLHVNTQGLDLTQPMKVKYVYTYGSLTIDSPSSELFMLASPEEEAFTIQTTNAYGFSSTLFIHKTSKYASYTQNGRDIAIQRSANGVYNYGELLLFSEPIRMTYNGAATLISPTYIPRVLTSIEKSGTILRFNIGWECLDLSPTYYTIYNTNGLLIASGISASRDMSGAYIGIPITTPNLTTSMYIQVASGGGPIESKIFGNVISPSAPDFSDMIVYWTPANGGSPTIVIANALPADAYRFQRVDGSMPTELAPQGIIQLQNTPFVDLSGMAIQSRIGDFWSTPVSLPPAIPVFAQDASGDMSGNDISVRINTTQETLCSVSSYSLVDGLTNTVVATIVPTAQPTVGVATVVFADISSAYYQFRLRTTNAAGSADSAPFIAYNPVPPSTSDPSRSSGRAVGPTTGAVRVKVSVPPYPVVISEYKLYDALTETYLGTCDVEDISGERWLSLAAVSAKYYSFYVKETSAAGTSQSAPFTAVLPEAPLLTEKLVRLNDWVQVVFQNRAIANYTTFKLKDANTDEILSSSPAVSPGAKVTAVRFNDISSSATSFKLVGVYAGMDMESTTFTLTPPTVPRIRGALHRYDGVLITLDGFVDDYTSYSLYAADGTTPVANTTTTSIPNSDGTYAVLFPLFSDYISNTQFVLSATNSIGGGSTAFTAYNTVFTTEPARDNTMYDHNGEQMNVIYFTLDAAQLGSGSFTVSLKRLDGTEFEQNGYSADATSISCQFWVPYDDADFYIHTTKAGVSGESVYYFCSLASAIINSAFWSEGELYMNLRLPEQTVITSVMKYTPFVHYWIGQATEHVYLKSSDISDLASYPNSLRVYTTPALNSNMVYTPPMTPEQLVAPTVSGDMVWDEEDMTLTATLDNAYDGVELYREDGTLLANSATGVFTVQTTFSSFYFRSYKSFDSGRIRLRSPVSATMALATNTQKQMSNVHDLQYTDPALTWWVKLPSFLDAANYANGPQVACTVQVYGTDASDEPVYIDTTATPAAVLDASAGVLTFSVGKEQLLPGSFQYTVQVGIPSLTGILSSRAEAPVIVPVGILANPPGLGPMLRNLLGPLNAGIIDRGTFKANLAMATKNLGSPIASLSGVNISAALSTVANGVDFSGREITVIAASANPNMPTVLQPSDISGDKLVYFPNSEGSTAAFRVEGGGSYVLDFPAGGVDLNADGTLEPGFILNGTPHALSDAFAVRYGPTHAESRVFQLVGIGSGAADAAAAGTQPRASADTSLKTFTIQGQSVQSGATITLNGVKVANVVAEPNDINATVGTITGNAFIQDGTYTISFVVSAQTGATKEYHATVVATNVPTATYVPPTSVPCFLGGAPILTPSGYKKIRSLREGDMVLTGDGRAVPIQRVVVKEVEASKRTNPYRVLAGYYGATHDVLVSPDHRIMIPSYGYVEARNLHFAQEQRVGTLEYYNLELPDWERDTLVVSGLVCESMAPVRRVAMTMDAFKALMSKKYGAAAASPEVLQKMLRSCKLLPDGRVEAPVIRNAKQA
jgi:hypothetical protein